LGLALRNDGAAVALGTELFVRHARRQGRSVAILRAYDYGDSCVVEAVVFPATGILGEPVHPGPYTFAGPADAKAFVEETMRALIYLGCEVH
jgi:hypothetical protein